MKKLIFALMMVVASSANAVEPMCGFADEIFAYLKTQYSGKPSMNVLVKGRQGETGRVIRAYASGAWFVTFEFYSDGDVKNDVSCIIATGAHGDPTAYELIDKKIQTLPVLKYKNFGANPQDFIPLRTFVPGK